MNELIDKYSKWFISYSFFVDHFNSLIRQVVAIDRYIHWLFRLTIRMLSIAPHVTSMFVSIVTHWFDLLLTYAISLILKHKKIQLDFPLNLFWD
jgi:hypothetical protein